MVSDDDLTTAREMFGPLTDEHIEFTRFVTEAEPALGRTALLQCTGD